jgi:hypothetical protein
VRRVRDELALGAFAALLVGQVADDEDAELPRRRGHAGEREHALVVRPHTPLLRRVCGEEPGGERAHRLGLPGLRQRRAGPQLAEHRARDAVRELHRQVRVDRHDTLLEALEQPLEPVAVCLDLPERGAEAVAHPVERRREVADLVREVRRERGLEVAALDRGRGTADPAQAERDQRRDHRADEPADDERDPRRPVDLVPHDPELGLELRV